MIQGDRDRQDTVPDTPLPDAQNFAQAPETIAAAYEDTVKPKGRGTLLAVPLEDGGYLTAEGDPVDYVQTGYGAPLNAPLNTHPMNSSPAHPTADPETNKPRFMLNPIRAVGLSIAILAIIAAVSATLILQRIQNSTGFYGSGDTVPKAVRKER